MSSKNYQSLISVHLASLHQMFRRCNTPHTSVRQRSVFAYFSSITIAAIPCESPRGPLLLSYPARLQAAQQMQVLQIGHHWQAIIIRSKLLQHTYKEHIFMWFNIRWPPYAARKRLSSRTVFQRSFQGGSPPKNAGEFHHVFYFPWQETHTPISPPMHISRNLPRRRKGTPPCNFGLSVQFCMRLSWCMVHG